MSEKKAETRVIGPGLVAAKKKESMEERGGRAMVGREGATTLDEKEEVSIFAISFRLISSDTTTQASSL